MTFAYQKTEVTHFSCKRGPPSQATVIFGGHTVVLLIKVRLLGVWLDPTVILEASHFGGGKMRVHAVNRLEACVQNVLGEVAKAGKSATASSVAHNRSHV